MTGTQDWPDIRVLWERKPTARKPHRCDRCAEEIRIGERYEDTGLINDGVFERLKHHLGAYAWPSHCPALREKDLAELAAEEQRDRAHNPYRVRDAKPLLRNRETGHG